jgi:archaellum component FlaC
MVFFGRKKKEENVEEIRGLVEGTQNPEEIPEMIEGEVVPEEAPKLAPIAERNEEEVVKPEMQKKPSFAPLFVKIDKYRSILNSINEIKTPLIMIKNTFMIQKEIEGLRDENKKMLELAISKLDKKIITLDSEFLRPTGFEEEFPSQMYESGGIEGVVDDLKKQIEGLKSELKTIS